MGSALMFLSPPVCEGAGRAAERVAERTTACDGVECFFFVPPALRLQADLMAPLHVAAKAGCAGAVRALLAKGADANAMDKAREPLGGDPFPSRVDCSSPKLLLLLLLLFVRKPPFCLPAPLSTRQARRLTTPNRNNRRV